MEADQEQQRAFEQVKAFAAKSEYFGIPADLFYGIIALAVTIGAALRSPLMALVIFLFLAVPMYRIHREDPFALKVWIRSVQRRHQRWCAGRSTKRELVIIQREES